MPPFKLAAILLVAAAGCQNHPRTATVARAPEAGTARMTPSAARRVEDAAAGTVETTGAPRSPHWSHLRLQLTDYRTSYLDDRRQRDREYAWTAAHADAVTLDYQDRGSVPVYRQLNPTMALYRYALNWTVLQPGQEPGDAAVSYFSLMQRWYAARPAERLEDAFLHDARRCPAGTPATSRCRVSIRIWTQDRWVLNPAVPAVQAFQAERLRAVAADADGLFVDEHASGDILDRLQPLAIREYPQLERYQRALTAQVARLRTALGRKPMLLNSSEHITDWDAEMVAAAGGAHTERLNNPVHPDMERRWRFVERLLQSGAVVDFATGREMPRGFRAGGYGTPEERRRLWELASYYLVVPAPPDRLRHHLAVRWDRPFEEQWLAAITVNVGRPGGTRRVHAEGRDGRGRPYRVWGRPFSGALVLVRPIIDWQDRAHDDATAIDVPLPGDAIHRPLRADGSLGAPIRRVRLRAAEAAILLRER